MHPAGCGGVNPSKGSTSGSATGDAAQHSLVAAGHGRQVGEHPGPCHDLPQHVAQALGRNPFMIIVPCHRVLEAGHYPDRISANGGSVSKRRLLSIEGAQPTTSKTLFDVLLPVARPRPQA